MKKLLTLLLLAASFASCGVNRPLVSVAPEELQQIDKIALVDIASNIALIEKGNYGSYNQTVSDTAEQIITGVFAASEYPHFGLVKAEERLQPSVEDESAWLLNYAADKDAFANIDVPQTIASLVADGGFRYGMIVRISGFERTSSNYFWQSMMGVGIGILSLGMFYTIPYVNNNACSGFRRPNRQMRLLSRF